MTGARRIAQAAVDLAAALAVLGYHLTAATLNDINTLIKRRPR